MQRAPRWRHFPATLTLRHRLQLLVVAFLVFTVTVALAAQAAITERDAALADVSERIEPTREAVSTLVAGMTDQETSLRGYLLTRDPSFLEPYETGVMLTDGAISRLQDLARDDVDLADPVAATVAAARRWQQEIAAAELALARDGRFDDAIALVSARRERFEEFRAEARELRITVLQLQSVGSQRADLAQDRLAAVGYAMAVAAGVLALASGWLLRRWVSAPLAQISASIDRVTAGDLHHSVDAAGPPELATLASNVDRMRARAVGLLDEAVGAREALEQQGPAVVSLRAELEPAGGPLPDTVALAATLHPAEGILAGDWYDCVELGNGRVAMLIVDVSGHGPVAGVFAVRAKHLLLAAMLETAGPGEALGWLADHIGDTGELFLTGIIVELNPLTGRLRWANAGHPAGVVLAGDHIERLDATGPLLGPIPGVWTTRDTTLPPEGVVMAFTDGIAEARTGSDQFGESGLLHTLQATQQDPERMVAAAVDAVRSFTGGALADDVTLVALQRRTTAGASTAPSEPRSAPHARAVEDQPVWR